MRFKYWIEFWVTGSAFDMIRQVDSQLDFGAMIQAWKVAFDFQIYEGSGLEP
jgi:hypothetical protein